MVDDIEILKFIGKCGVCCSYHIDSYYDITHFRTITRILKKLQERGFLDIVGALNKQGKGKPFTIYALSKLGAETSGMRLRSFNTLTSVRRSILVADYISQLDNDIYIASLIEDKDYIFNNFDMQFPFRDKWFANTITYIADDLPVVVIPYTDYSALARFIKESSNLECGIRYILISNNEICERVKHLIGETGKDALYHQKKTLDEWKQALSEIINNDKKLEHLADLKKRELIRILDHMKKNNLDSYLLKPVLDIYCVDTHMIYHNK